VVSLGLRTVVVGVFDNDGVGRLLQMQDDEQALCMYGLWNMLNGNLAIGLTDKMQNSDA